MSTSLSVFSGRWRRFLLVLVGMALLAIPSSAFAVTTSQKSTSGSYNSDLARDCNTADSDATTSQTLSEASGSPAWLKIDLGSPQLIKSIKLWARTTNVTSNYWIFISNNPFDTTTYPTPQQILSAGGNLWYYNAQVAMARYTNWLVQGGAGVTGRYLLIQLNGAGALSLAEIELPDVSGFCQSGGGDTTAPTVSISSPSSGTSYTTAQTVSITANASDNVNVTKVEFYKGGVLQATDTSAPYAFAWAITSSSNGSHSFTAKAYDAANNSASSSAVSLTVNISAPADTTPPTVSISSPSSGTSYTTAQTVNINATASDNVGVTKVEFYKGGVLQATDTSAPFSFAWPITSSINGSHSFTAKAYDAANNNTTSTAVSLTVNIPGSDTTAPTVSISSPSNGSSYTTAQTVNINATASDNVGVTRVEFYKGGVLQATDTSAPFSFAWPITSGINGSHTFTAKAYDAANNSSTLSSAVNLVVNIPAATSRTMWQPNRVTATYNSGCTSGSGALNDGFIKDNPPLCATNGAITLTFTAPTLSAKVNYVALMGYTGTTAPNVTLYTGSPCTTQSASVAAVKDLSEGAWEAKFLSPPSGVCKVIVGTASSQSVSELAVYATPWPAKGETGWPAVSSPNFPSLPSYASDLTVNYGSPSPTIDDFMAKVLKDNHAELNWVLEKAHALLSNGFTAGSGYGVYARDTATFIEEDIRHQPQQNSDPLKTTSWIKAKDALISLWANQQGTGAIPDTTSGTSNWTTTETDQESSLIRATYLYLTLTNSSNLSLSTSISGQSLQVRMENALKYVMNNRIAPAYGLVWSGTMVDWGDVELGLPAFKATFDNTSSPAITAYTNALFVRALDHYIELTGGTNATWINVRDNIKQNLRAYLWDSANLKWYPHRYTVKGPPVNDSVSYEDPKFYHGGTTVAMQAGLSFPNEKDSMISRMLLNAANAKNSAGQNWNPTVGLTLDVGYNSTWDPLMYNNVYQDGGDWDWFGGRTDQVIASAGRPYDAWLQLDKSYQRQRDTTHNRYQGAATEAFREIWEPHSSCGNNPEGTPDTTSWGCRSKDVMGWAGELSKAIRTLQRQAQDYRDEKASRPSNTITASSYLSTAYKPHFAFDEDPNTEWVDSGLVCAGANITITFPTAHKISGVVLHDRENTTDQVLTGHIVLTSSPTPCSNINVTSLNDTGKPYFVDVLASCPSNNTTTVQFVVDSCKAGTQHIGLREIEIYEENNPVNLARNALTVTASSEFSPSFAATQAINGIYGSSELGGWKSYSESNPWLMLTWDTPRTISRLVVYDRPSASEKYSSFKLEFSDNSSITSVDMYPTDPNFLYDSGAPREVILPSPKTVTSVKFTGTGYGTATNNGLSEFEVFENRNLAYDAMTSASSTYFISSPLMSTHPAFATIDGFVNSDTEGYWQPNGADSTPTVTYRWPKVASKSVRAVEVWDVPSAANNINCARVTFVSSPNPTPASDTPEATCTSNYCDITVIPQDGHSPGKLYLTNAVNVTSVTVQPGVGVGCAGATGNKAIAEVRILGY